MAFSSGRGDSRWESNVAAFSKPFKRTLEILTQLFLDEIEDIAMSAAGKAMELSTPPPTAGVELH